MRPIWNGHISFGLISIPASLYSAVGSSERVAFRLLHRRDHPIPCPPSSGLRLPARV